MLVKLFSCMGICILCSFSRFDDPMEEALVCAKRRDLHVVPVQTGVLEVRMALQERRRPVHSVPEVVLPEPVLSFHSNKLKACNTFLIISSGLLLSFDLRNWKMRWFVLRDSKLMYYDNDSEEKLKGTIDIKAAKYKL